MSIEMVCCQWARGTLQGIPGEGAGKHTALLFKNMQGVGVSLAFIICCVRLLGIFPLGCPVCRLLVHNSCLGGNGKLGLMCNVGQFL